MNNATSPRKEQSSGADTPLQPGASTNASAGDAPVNLHIMDSEYRVACPPDEQDALLAAAQHLDDTMQGIRNTGKVVGVERIAVMAALNISYELLNNQKQSTRLEKALNQRIRELLEQTDRLLSKLQQNSV